jgi:predicted DNA binding CopG/RHH family protein
MKNLKKIPKFKTEAEERRFWQRVDSTKYVDWSKAEKWVFPNLKLTSTPITIRIPDSLLSRVKVKAHQRDIPYQTLIKQFIYKGVGEYIQI